MDKKIAELIEQHPKLTYLLRHPRFQALSEAHKDYVLEMVDDAIFWVDLDKTKSPDDGFKFLGATFGLHRAQQEAKEQGLDGDQRERFLRPHQDLYTQFNPYSGRSND